MKRVKKTKAWYAEFLPPERRGVFLPEYLCKLRNNCIVAIGIQVLASIAGLTFYFFRRVFSTYVCIPYIYRAFYILL